MRPDFMRLKIDSPYLKSPKRLADILAAIQVMGAHTWDRQPLKNWLPSLGGRPQSVPQNDGSWEVIFREHPEFFGEELPKDPAKQPSSPDVPAPEFFLRWRRAFERTYDPIALRVLEPAEIKELKDAKLYDETKISRRPLESDE